MKMTQGCEEASLGVLTEKWWTKRSSAGFQDYRGHTLQTRGEIDRHTGDDEDCNGGVDPDDGLIVKGMAG